MALRPLTANGLYATMPEIMAQPAPTSPEPHSATAPTLVRPLPRRTPSRPARPRFQILDAVNAALFPAIFVIVCRFLHAPFAAGMLLGALSVATLYGLGWRMAGRACGVTASLLLATSVTFAREATHAAPLFMLAVFGSTFLLLLWACATTRAARTAWVVAVLAGAGGLAAGSAWGQVAGPHLRFSAAALQWLVSPGQAFLCWFWLPFVAEMGDRTRRARWLPLLLWTAAALAACSCVQWAGVPMALFVIPAALLLTAGGMARLLPILAGEVPTLRYLLATLAVIGLVVVRARLEWGQ